MPSSTETQAQTAPEMVERVALALQTWNYHLSFWPERGPSPLTHVLPIWYSAARNAIAAMREPTPAMVEAFPDCAGGSGFPCSIVSDEIYDAWRAMIDAALGEAR